MCPNFPSSVTPLMTPSGLHSHGHATQSEKNVKALKHINLSAFSPLFNILTLIFIKLCIDFVSFLKNQILTEFHNIEIFIIYGKKV